MKLVRKTEQKTVMDKIKNKIYSIKLQVKPATCTLMRVKADSDIACSKIRKLERKIKGNKVLDSGSDRNSRE